MIQITLHNAMAVSTGQYQQMVEINSSAYSGLINSNWTNGLPYYTSNGSAVEAWLESNATNTSKNTILWLNLYPIAPNGWTNVSIAFGPKSSFKLSAAGPLGEAPQLSSTYGKFDNGAKVFTFYDDFVGSSLSSQWANTGSWVYSVSNGFSTNSVPGGSSPIVSSVSFEYPMVVDFYGNLFESASASFYTSEGIGSGGSVSAGNARLVQWEASNYPYAGPTPYAASGSSYTIGVSSISSQQYAVFTTEVVNTSAAFFLANYRAQQNLTNSIPLGPQPIELAGSGSSAGSLTNAQGTTWIRERSYVATMPAATFTELLKVTFSETGLPSGATWWVNVSGGPSTHSMSSSLGFLEPVGNFSYTVASNAPVVTPHPPSGTFRVSGGAVTRSVSFTLSPGNYSLDFVESGLPDSTNWVVTIGNTSLNSTTDSIEFVERNGTYSWSITPIAGYSSRWKGNVTIGGADSEVAIGFSRVNYTVAFTESGLAAGATWTVTVGSVTHSSSTQLVTFSEPNGTYAWSITPIAGFNTTWKG
ncbi:MAG TPA: hypothetical protein VGS23_04980, partial [Thermoplasmata archaeon]|nr:hypothetical protein [Thermoplasmata archaeon]